MKGPRLPLSAPRGRPRPFPWKRWLPRVSFSLPCLTAVLRYLLLTVVVVALLAPLAYWGATYLNASDTRPAPPPAPRVARVHNDKFTVPLKPPPHDLPLLDERIIVYKHDGSGYFLQVGRAELFFVGTLSSGAAPHV